jgi:plasmid replication initiation protein
METSKSMVQRPRRRALRKAPGELLPARVQKSYFMLSSAERDLLNTALEKFRPGRHEPVLVGGLDRLKTALKLMGVYRLVIEEVQDARAMTNYTRWIEAVLVNETEDQVYVTFSPRFEHLWLEVKKRLLEHAASNPAKTKLRGRYALRLYNWAHKHVQAGTKRISLEQLRKIFGLEDLKDADGNTLQEGPLPVWANFHQRALVPAIAEINAKTDLKIAIESMERKKHRRVTALSFSIKPKTETAR